MSEATEKDKSSEEQHEISIVSQSISPGCCCQSEMTRISADSLQHSKPVRLWRSRSSEDWLHQEAERRSELVPEIRSLTEGSPAERGGGRNEMKQQMKKLN